MTKPRRVLLTGATGFVGKRVYPALVEAGWHVRSGSRDPERHAREDVGREWVRFVTDDAASVASAVQGVDAVVPGALDGAGR